MTESPRQDPLDVCERIVGQMNADILGPRPRQIPKSWPDDLEKAIAQLRAERARVEEVANEMESVASRLAEEMKDAWSEEECPIADPEEISAWATRLKEGRT